jgi:hypothetical protein
VQKLLADKTAEPEIAARPAPKLPDAVREELTAIRNELAMALSEDR